MTSDELAKLTPEEKRIRIAELDGWERTNTNGHPHNWHPDTRAISTCDGQYPCAGFPDYLGDLNVLHRLESELRLDRLQTFRDALAEICERDWKAGTFPQRNPIHAAAAQRADAFLLACG